MNQTNKLNKFNKLNVVLTTLFAFSLVLTSLSVNTLATGLPNRYSSSVYEVAPSDGLNMRDRDCKKIGLLPKGEILVEENYPNSNQNDINCNLGDVSYVMKPMNKYSKYEQGTSSVFYVAASFLNKIGQVFSGYDSDGGVGKGGGDMIVNSSNGINLRDKDCKKIGSAKNGAVLKSISQNGIICKIANQTYHLKQVNYNGQNYYAASLFLK